MRWPAHVSFHAVEASVHRGLSGEENSESLPRLRWSELGGTRFGGNVFLLQY